MATQVIDQKKKVVIALNMMDLVQKNGTNINIEKLSKLLGVEIIPINANLGKGLDNLKSALLEAKVGKPTTIPLTESSVNTKDRYSLIDRFLEKVIEKKGENKALKWSDKLDSILTHKIFGYIIFLSLLMLIFQTIFAWSEYPMGLIETLFEKISVATRSLIPEGILQSLIVDGIIAGLGGVVIFVPQITYLFLFILILEDTGYMARASYLMDKLLRPFGLNGKSVIPLISSSACAIPAIMGARTIPNQKERLITMFVAPLISCSARIPVYTLLIGMIVPKDSSIGPFNTQGLLLMGLYLLGFAAALLSALILKLTLKTTQKSKFLLEMPIYRKPRLWPLFLNVFAKLKVFVLDAGKIIVSISIILWVMSSYGPGNSFQEIEDKYANNTELTETQIDEKVANEQLEASYAGILGKTIEPVIRPLGYDWKIGIALVTSFAAREVFVGTIATLYSVGDKEDEVGIREKMKNATFLDSGEKIYSKATILSLLIFYAFAMQCMATLAIVKRETNSIKWPLIQLVYMGALAYFSSLLVYSIFA